MNWPKWDEWVDVHAVKAVTRHATGAAYAIVVFGMVGFLTQLLWPEGEIKHLAEQVDQIVLLCLIARMGYELVLGKGNDNRLFCW